MLSKLIGGHVCRPFDWRLCEVHSGSKADDIFWWGDERRKALGKGTSRNWGREFWVSWNCDVRELNKIMFSYVFDVSLCACHVSTLSVPCLCISVYAIIIALFGSLYFSPYSEFTSLEATHESCDVLWFIIPLLRVFEERHRHEQANSTVLLFSFHMHIVTWCNLYEFVVMQTVCR